MIYPVILCGGTGSRLWPLSRSLMPKQFLPLVSERSMLQETVLRLTSLDETRLVVLVSNDEHRFIAAEQMRGAGIAPHMHLLEPVGRNTAPAVAAAALALVEADPDAVLLVLPADHVIADAGRFRVLVREAINLAQTGRLVTFGIKPDAPATGYGYIRRGAAMAGHDNAYHVAAFVEKPSAEHAAEYISRGDYLWNSGMFVFRAARYLEELARFRPDILKAVRQSVDRASRDLDFLRLDASAFSACPSDSVDYAVMEKTDSACVLAADIGWNDIGSWSALWDIADKDDDGNSARGDVYLDRVSDCYVRAEGRLIAAVGVSHLVIVETADAVLVADKACAQDVKLAVEHLKTASRHEHLTHKRVYRPWGYFESIDSGERFQAKRLMLKPGAKISLQRHQRRAEHWVVVSGHARVTRDNEVLELREDQSTYIPQGVTHRLENIGPAQLYVIEVQSGDYLGEDDIERFADDYSRS